MYFFARQKSLILHPFGTELLRVFTCFQDYGVSQFECELKKRQEDCKKRLEETWKKLPQNGNKNLQIENNNIGSFAHFAVNKVSKKFMEAIGNIAV